MSLPIVSPLRLPRATFPWTLESIAATIYTFEGAVERLVRSAVENCATNVLLTRLPPIMAANFEASLLSPSLRKRLKVVDQRDALWKPIQAYFEPMSLDMARMQAFMDLNVHGSVSLVTSELECLARNFHLLLIAARENAQVEINIIERCEILKALIAQHQEKFRPESRARLSILLGVLNGLGTETATVDALHVRAKAIDWLPQRLDEILDDAYLAEASSLKRFISYESNKASVRRDLRQLLRAIIRERRWAKSVVVLGKQLLVLPALASDALSSFVENVGVPTRLGPVVLPATTIPRWVVAQRSPDAPLLRCWAVPARFLSGDTATSFQQFYEFEEA